MKLSMKSFLDCRFVMVAVVTLIVIADMLIKNQSSVKTMAETEEINLPVIMYHSITDSSNQSTYVLSVSELEEDIVYLKNQGYSFVGTRELSDYVNGSGKLPQKPVMLTFDDGYMNNYNLAHPILKKYGAKAIISPIGSQSVLQKSDPHYNNTYASLTEEQLREMEESGIWDVENHSYDLHYFDEKRQGTKINPGENKDEYRRLFAEDMKKEEEFIQKATGKRPIAYTFPYGAICPEVETLIKCFGYKISFGCEEGINIITKNPSCLFNLKRFNRTPLKKVSHFLS